MSLWNIHTEPVDAAIDISASGDTTLVASSSTSHNYIFNVSVVVANPTTITLKCGSRSVAKYTLQANATMSISAADYVSGQPYFICRPGEAFILSSSSAVESLELLSTHLNQYHSMYALPQEKQAIDTFSGQRDELIKEVSQLTIQKDKLNSEIKELLHTLTSTREEIETTNELMKAQLKGEGAVSEKVKATIESLKKETEYIREQKDKVTVELHERIAFLQETSSSVEKIAREVSQTQNALTGVYKDIHNAATWMKEAVVEIQQIFNEVKTTASQFKDDVVKYEKEVNERTQFLDKKESLILARERAVDEKYLSLVKQAQEGLN